MTFPKVSIRSMCVYFFLATFLLITVLAFPQEPNGALAGTVRDVGGALVVGAKVSVTSTGSGASKSTTSDSRGEFRLEALSPGEYQLEVSAPNFSVAHSVMNIAVGSVASVAIVL